MSKLNIPKTVKMVVTDFDGILTDGGIFINQDLSVSRKVNFKDIMGVSLLVKAGIKVGIISGEKNPIIDFLKDRFSLTETHQDIRLKIDVLKSIIERNNLTPDEIIYLGDDINDIECLKFASTRITVPGSTDAVKKVEGIQITTNTGGDGAFREVVNCLLNI